MMNLYGECTRCGAEGALWRARVHVKRFWLFGPLVPRTVYLCDECG